MLPRRGTPSLSPRTSPIHRRRIRQLGGNMSEEGGEFGPRACNFPSTRGMILRLLPAPFSLGDTLRAPSASASRLVLLYRGTSSPRPHPSSLLLALWALQSMDRHRLPREWLPPQLSIIGAMSSATSFPTRRFHALSNGFNADPHNRTPASGVSLLTFPMPDVASVLAGRWHLHGEFVDPERISWALGRRWDVISSHSPLCRAANHTPRYAIRATIDLDFSSSCWPSSRRLMHRVSPAEIASLQCDFRCVLLSLPMERLADGPKVTNFRSSMYDRVQVHAELGCSSASLRALEFGVSMFQGTATLEVVTLVYANHDAEHRIRLMRDFPPMELKIARKTLSSPAFTLLNSFIRSGEGFLPRDSLLRPRAERSIRQTVGDIHATAERSSPSQGPTPIHPSRGARQSTPSQSGIARHLSSPTTFKIGFLLVHLLDPWTTLGRHSSSRLSVGKLPLVDLGTPNPHSQPCSPLSRTALDPIHAHLHLTPNHQRASTKVPSSLDMTFVLVSDQIVHDVVCFAVDFSLSSGSSSRITKAFRASTAGDRDATIVRISAKLRVRPPSLAFRSTFRVLCTASVFTFSPSTTPNPFFEQCAAIDRATRHPSSLLRIRTSNLEIWRERQELRVHYHSLKLSFSLILTERYTKPQASPTRFRTVGASIVLFASITASTRPQTSSRLSMTPKGHRSPEEAFLRTPNENAKDEPRLHLHYNEVNTRDRGSSGQNATQLALSLQVVNLTPSYRTNDSALTSTQATANMGDELSVLGSKGQQISLGLHLPFALSAPQMPCARS
ncbi:hypothetical protein NMY22_g12205 [Coprinellus aureogranulatus]|nr:hypothetical protein NMY22_g12205 [Coprinellus aureogranulatus]